MSSITLSRSMIIAIVAVVCIGLIVAVVIFFSDGSNDSDDDNTGDIWHKGDFVEWGTFYYEAGGQPLDSAGYQRYTVTAVDEEWVTINRTFWNPARILLSYDVVHVLTNSTGFGFSEGSLISLGYDVVQLGPDSVDTEWGTLSAQHYQYNYTIYDVQYTVDIWVRNGFFIMEKTTQESGMQMAIILTDTNIAEIYTP